MKLKLSREMKIGVFGVMMIACLYWGINFLKGNDLFSRVNTYYAVYDQVNGIKPSSQIVIKGYKVGVISGMTYNPKDSEKIILEFRIKSKFAIPENSQARIFSDGIMGGKAIEIELGDSKRNLADGDTLKSVADKDFLEVAGSEFEFLKQRANTLVNEVMVTLNHVNTILGDNAQHINTSMSNVASISTNLNEVVAAEKGSIQEIVQNLNALSLTLKTKSTQIDKIINNAESFSDSLAKSQIPSTIASLNNTLSELNMTLAKVNNGEGTVGKFMTDQSLYDSLLMSSGKLSALLEDMKKNPGRYINISVFGRKNK